MASIRINSIFAPLCNCCNAVTGMTFGANINIFFAVVNILNLKTIVAFLLFSSKVISIVAVLIEITLITVVQSTALEAWSNPVSKNRRGNPSHLVSVIPEVLRCARSFRATRFFCNSNPKL